jgi:hypothetical protein
MIYQLRDGEIFMKQCSLCKEVKDLSFFNKETKSKDGFGSRCRACQKIQFNIFYNDKEGQIFRKKEKERKILLGVKLCKECGLEKNTKCFYKETKKKNGLSAWCRDCKDKSTKKWRKNNPEKVQKTKLKHKEKYPQYHVDRYWEDPEKYKKQSKKWREENPLKVKVIRKKSYDKDPQKSINRSKKYAKNNPEKIKVRMDRWVRENPEKILMYCAKRRAAKFNAIPSWADEEHDRQIEEIYQLAKELQWLSEEPFHVDHDIPLQGKNISGLHIPSNLQILPASVNLSKHNKFDQIEHDRINLPILIEKMKYGQ